MRDRGRVQIRNRGERSTGKRGTRLRGHLSKRAAFLVLAALPYIYAASTPARAEGEGFYGPLGLKDNEQILIRNAGEYEQKFDRRGYLYGSPELDTFVARIGARLAPKPTDDYVRYRFRVLRDSEPGAFTLPDGQVYVNSGLLAVMDNEAQLAAVLAHEIQHAAGHHGILSYRSARRKLITSMVLGPLTLGVGDYYLMRSIMGYSRDLEEECDRQGAAKMVKAGYDPRQMSRLFVILMEDAEGERPSSRPSKWSSHPELQARVEYTRALVPGLLVGVDPASLKVNGTGYRSVVRRAALDTVADLIDQDYPRTAVALAQRIVRESDGSAAAHLALGNGMLALGARAILGGESGPSDREKRRAVRERYWMTRQERQARLSESPGGREALRRNLDRARQEFSRALALDPDLAEAHRGLGYVYEGLDRPKDAGIEFVTYLKARPQAPDRQAILNALQGINDQLRNGGKSR